VCVVVVVVDAQAHNPSIMRYCYFYTGVHAFSHEVEHGTTSVDTRVLDQACRQCNGVGCNNASELCACVRACMHAFVRPRGHACVCLGGEGVRLYVAQGGSRARDKGTTNL
jgi:hypothetical protein